MPCSQDGLDYLPMVSSIALVLLALLTIAERMSPWPCLRDMVAAEVSSSQDEGENLLHDGVLLWMKFWMKHIHPVKYSIKQCYGKGVAKMACRCNL